MKTRAIALTIAGSLVLGSTVAVASSDDLSDLLPARIGDETMLPVPAEVMDVAAPIVPLDGVEGEIAMASNYDLAGFLAAAEQETLTEADGDAFLRWAEEEMVMVGALRFDGTPADEALESAAADPDFAANTIVAVLDGRDIVVRAPTDDDHWAWGFLYLYEEVLFFVISADPELQMREALAALPPPVDQTLPSGRIERPADGYAITFPDGWLVQEFTRELYIDVNGFPPEPDEVPYLFAQRVADRSTEVECQLNDFSDFALDWPVATVDEATELFGNAVEDDVRFMETVAGRVGHVRDGTFETYVYYEADRWVYLQCSDHEANEDIATIAQSFEFVPAK